MAARARNLRFSYFGRTSNGQERLQFEIRSYFFLNERLQFLWPSTSAFGQHFGTKTRDDWTLGSRDPRAVAAPMVEEKLATSATRANAAQFLRRLVVRGRDRRVLVVVLLAAAVLEAARIPRQVHGQSAAACCVRHYGPSVAVGAR